MASTNNIPPTNNYVANKLTFSSVHHFSLKEVPYRPSLPGEMLYDTIGGATPPELPPDRRRGTSGKGALPREGEEECTAFQNRSVRDNSTSSLRYVPSAHHEPIPTSSDGVYVEIDEAQAMARQRRRGHERRPSDYEPVLIRDPVTGRVEFVSTEESHPLSPSRSNTSSLRREVGSGGEETSSGKLDLADIPPLHPSQSGNDYAVIPNAGFQSHENSPPLEFKLPPSTEAEILKNEGYSENSESMRKYSVSNNPMYSTVAGPRKAKIAVNGSGGAESMKNPHFVEYDVPPDGPRPKPPSMARSPVNSMQHGNSSGGTGGHERGGFPADMPPTNTPLHSNDGGIPANAMYDVPPNNTPLHSNAGGVMI